MVGRKREEECQEAGRVPSREVELAHWRTLKRERRCSSQWTSSPRRSDWKGDGYDWDISRRHGGWDESNSIWSAPADRGTVWGPARERERTRTLNSRPVRSGHRKPIQLIGFHHGIGTQQRDRDNPFCGRLFYLKRHQMETEVSSREEDYDTAKNGDKVII